jgi:hypothetical protein
MFGRPSALAARRAGRVGACHAIAGINLRMMQSVPRALGRANDQPWPTCFQAPNVAVLPGSAQVVRCPVVTRSAREKGSALSVPADSFAQVAVQGSSQLRSTSAMRRASSYLPMEPQWCGAIIPWKASSGEATPDFTRSSRSATRSQLPVGDADARCSWVWDGDGHACATTVGRRPPSDGSESMTLVSKSERRSCFTGSAKGTDRAPSGVASATGSAERPVRREF